MSEDMAYFRSLIKCVMEGGMKELKETLDK